MGCGEVGLGRFRLVTFNNVRALLDLDPFSPDPAAFALPNTNNRRVWTLTLSQVTVRYVCLLSVRSLLPICCSQ